MSVSHSKLIKVTWQEGAGLGGYLSANLVSCTGSGKLEAVAVGLSGELVWWRLV